MASIFDIDWDNVSVNLTPHFWRENDDGSESSLMEVLRAVIEPIQTISDALYAKKDDTLANKNTNENAYLDVTGQHLALEEALNDIYDPSTRAIYITENDETYDAYNIDLYNQDESVTDFRPDNLYNQGEVEGEWDAATTYAIGEFVYYNNVMYESLAGANLNNIPSATIGVWWDIVEDSNGYTVNEFILYNQGEGIDIYNFTIYMPATITGVWDEDVVRAFLDRYVEITKKYNIIQL